MPYSTVYVCTLTGFTDVKPVNLESQVDKQLRHCPVTPVILPASQIRPRREFVHKVCPVHASTFSREKKCMGHKI